MIDAVDTFEEHFRSRVLAYNPSRQVMGVMDAMDWPKQDVELEAFYLLALGETPVEQAQSAIMPVYVHTIQITWVIVGTDIVSSSRGRNRGTRYRTNMQMKREVLNGLYPYFTDKKTFSLNTVTGDIVSSLLDPLEQISWSRAQFGPAEPAKDSGVVYGLATVYLADMTDKLTVNV